MYWNQDDTYQVDNSILRSVENIESVRSLAVSATNVGMNSDGVKAVPAGLFLASVGGAVRYLPRDTTRAAVSTSVSAIPVNYPELFITGDVLYSLEKYATLTIGGTLVAGEKVYFTYKDTTVTYTLGSTSTTTEATALAAALNASTALADKGLDFTNPSNGVVGIYSMVGGDDENFVSSNSASGTFTLTAFAPGGAVGTISGVDYANREIDLTANSAVALRSGAVVGTLTDMIYGLNIHSNVFTNKPTCHVNAITGASGVYQKHLPYWDELLRETFPKLYVY